MMEALPGLIKKFKVQGEIFDNDFEKAGIPGPNKDGLCISHRRSVLMHHDEVLKREKVVADAKFAKDKEIEDKKRKREADKLIPKAIRRKFTASSTSSINPVLLHLNTSVQL